MINSLHKWKRLLLVEDSLIMQRMNLITLLNQGYEVEIAHSGEEALLKYSDNNFDLILMDINLPGLTGIEVAHIIRQQNKVQRIPIIGITEYILNGLQKKCLDAGIDKVILKPITAEVLEFVLISLNNVPVAVDSDSDNGMMLEPLGEVAERLKALPC